MTLEQQAQFRLTARMRRWLAEAQARDVVLTPDMKLIERARFEEDRCRAALTGGRA